MSDSEEEAPLVVAKRPVGIEHFEIGQTLIETKRGSFWVRGMNTEDLTFLVVNYLEDVMRAMIEFGNKSDEDQLSVLDRSRWPEFMLMLTQGYPELVSEMISRCADAADHIERFRRLPFPVQLQAMHAIAVLTTEDAGGLGNLVAALRTLLETRGLRLGPLAKNLQNIIGSPVGTSASSTSTDTLGQADTR